MASYINGTLYKWCHAIMHIEIINNTRAGIEGKIWERMQLLGGKSAQK